MTYSSPTEPAAKRLCTWLCEHAGIDSEDIEHVRKAIPPHQQGQLPLLLVKLGSIAEIDLAQGWSQVLGIPLLEERDLRDGCQPITAVSRRFLLEHHALALLRDQRPWLVIADPTDHDAIRAVRHACGEELRIATACASAIDAAIARLHGDSKASPPADDGNDAIASDDIEHLKDLASGAPIVRMVNAMMQKAVDQRASDIHIEPFEKTLAVRLRVDGVLHDIDAPPLRSAAAMISRIKIMARLDIAERRLPQDGRIMLKINGRSIDLRVSTVPTSHGESVVMRLLDRGRIQLDFPTLGFDGDRLDQFLSLLDSPHGIVLVTGPTGSGKTTTLYTALSRLNQVERKIISVEDPVEYQLEGINQIQVKPAIGLDFPDALRAIMRQDPDVVMIGEMRDLATCRIAVQASLTGHLVLSTLHTNSATESITRLLDMGVENYLLASTVRGVLAQRLVRRLDPATRIAYHPPPETIAQLGLDQLGGDHSITLYRADPTAPGGGYQGRSAITELLLVDDGIRELLGGRADAQRIEADARQRCGFRSLHEEGLRQALLGITSIEEVLRVTGKEP